MTNRPTPETDAVTLEFRTPEDRYDGRYVPADFACALQRSRDEAVELLRDFVNSGVRYKASDYSEMQISHRALKDARAFLAAFDKEKT